MDIGPTFYANGPGSIPADAKFKCIFFLLGLKWYEVPSDSGRMS